LWVCTHREKTGVPSRIPLLPQALKIIDKYQSFPLCKKTGNVLPVLSNQKMNAYLKEVADLCGITKPVTFHTARHTFATTVMLTNGVPIETVSQMMGHKSLSQTQHYAKVLDVKVSEDMNALRNRLSRIE
jgi:site-specific recombinase XerD